MDPQTSLRELLHISMLSSILSLISLIFFVATLKYYLDNLWTGVHERFRGPGAGAMLLMAAVFLVYVFRL
jgi:hypothetical protein